MAKEFVTHAEIESIIRKVMDEHEVQLNQLFSVKDVAKWLDVSRQTIYRLSQPDENGQIHLRPTMVGKHQKFKRWDINQYLTSRSSVSRHI